MDVVRCSCSLFPHPSIDDLPDCLLNEILTRLPLKSIFQCKCVSHRWCSLISASSFAYFVNRLHASSILQRPSTLLISHYIYGMRKVLVTSEEPEFKSLASLINQYDSNNSFVSLDSFVPLHIVQASCHDLLLCCENVVGDDMGSGSMTLYYILNPITRQSVTLPTLRYSGSARIGFIISCYDNIAHDHDKQHQQFSYKVMRIPRFEGE
uniref:F-box domain-containing protein n=1 Tax=Quercus lobata TaxID=97700 RepID=A0A7N2LNB2_QUELO